MKELVADKNLIAFCGLYCGACGSYLKGKCQGCQKNEKAYWCKVRLCCLQNNYSSCAQCNFYSDTVHCEKFNNIFSKIIGFFMNSDRRACIELIRAKGPEEYAKFMALNKTQRIKKRG
jgi:hypothetical protein